MWNHNTFTKLTLYLISFRFVTVLKGFSTSTCVYRSWGVVLDMWKRRIKCFLATEEAVCNMINCTVGNVGSRFWRAVHWWSAELILHCWTHYEQLKSKWSLKFCACYVLYKHLLTTLPTMPHIKFIRLNYFVHICCSRGIGKHTLMFFNKIGGVAL